MWASVDRSAKTPEAWPLHRLRDLGDGVPQRAHCQAEAEMTGAGGQLQAGQRDVNALGADAVDCGCRGVDGSDELLLSSGKTVKTAGDGVHRQVLQGDVQFKEMDSWFVCFCGVGTPRSGRLQSVHVESRANARRARYPPA
jgi:hypothetical protein